MIYESEIVSKRQGGSVWRAVEKYLCYEGGDSMFLDMLKSADEKESFMDLAYWVATADGSLGLPEIKMLDMFSQETGIENWRQRSECNCVPQACTVFADDFSRKIAYSNLLAIGCVEEFENSSQSRAIDQVRAEFSISQELEQSFRQWMGIVKGSCWPRNYLE